MEDYNAIRGELPGVLRNFFIRKKSLVLCIVFNRLHSPVSRVNKTKKRLKIYIF